MNASLQALIEAFEKETAGALTLFLQRAELPHPFTWRENSLPRKGTLPGSPRIAYRFHGTGLYLKRGSKVIDFAFGFDGRTGGFNSWWLARFAEENPERFGAFTDHTVLEKMLTEAREAGEIGKIFAAQQDGLEYRIMQQDQKVLEQ